MGLQVKELQKNAYELFEGFYKLNITNFTENYLNYFLIFGYSFSITYLLTPLIIKLGDHFGIHDIPNNRKQHKKPTVRLGGFSHNNFLYIHFIFIFNN